MRRPNGEGGRHSKRSAKLKSGKLGRARSRTGIRRHLLYHEGPRFRRSVEECSICRQAIISKTPIGDGETQQAAAQRTRAARCQLARTTGYAIGRRLAHGQVVPADGSKLGHVRSCPDRRRDAIPASPCTFSPKGTEPLIAGHTAATAALTGLKCVHEAVRPKGCPFIVGRDEVPGDVRSHVELHEETFPSCNFTLTQAIAPRRSCRGAARSSLPPRWQIPLCGLPSPDPQSKDSQQQGARKLTPEPRSHCSEPQRGFPGSASAGRVTWSWPPTKSTAAASAGLLGMSSAHCQLKSAASAGQGTLCTAG